MYLILYPSRGMISISQNNECFDSVFTHDLHRVSEALKINGVRVYKIDSLTEIKSVEVSYTEVPKELT